MRRRGAHACTPVRATSGVTLQALAGRADWATFSVSRKARRCRCPLALGVYLPAPTMPAAHQRSAICRSLQRLTLRAWVRQMLIMLRRVRGPQRASQGGRHAQAQHGQGLAEALAQAARGPGVSLVQLAAQGVEFRPRLPTRSRTDHLGQALGMSVKRVNGDLRLHRRVVQHQMQALHPGLPQSGPCENTTAIDAT